MWEDLIQKAKDGGLDVIDTYVFWNLHEPSPGNVLLWIFTFFPLSFSWMFIFHLTLNLHNFFLIFLDVFSIILREEMTWCGSLRQCRK